MCTQARSESGGILTYLCVGDCPAALFLVTACRLCVQAQLAQQYCGFRSRGGAAHPPWHLGETRGAQGVQAVICCHAECGGGCRATAGPSPVFQGHRPHCHQGSLLTRSWTSSVPICWAILPPQEQPPATQMPVMGVWANSSSLKKTCRRWRTSLTSGAQA